jgi:hypothetical protein
MIRVSEETLMPIQTRPQTSVPSPDPMWLADGAPAPAPAWRPSVARPPVLQAPPKLLAKVGEAFATSLAVLQEQLRNGDPHDFEAGLAELARLENLGLQVQQLARMMSHDGTQSAEAIDLGDALSRAIAMWSPSAEARGVTLSQPDATTARVQVDPAVLEQLLDLAIELALEAGDSLAVRVRPQPASRQVLLLIDVHHGGPITSAASGAAAEDEGADNLRWLMLHQVARSGGIGARREHSGSMLSVALTFPLAALGSWYEPVPGQDAG